MCGGSICSSSSIDDIFIVEQFIEVLNTTLQHVRTFGNRISYFYCDNHVTLIGVGGGFVPHGYQEGTGFNQYVVNFISGPL